ncbi:acyl-CoA dehydrogenase, partial [Escherichia coli]|nr:acyl-CoA dehydrogenase [Escherichia coli]
LAGCDTPLANGWLTKIAEGACSATLATPFDLPAGAWQLPVVAEEAAGGYALSGTIEQVIDGARADLLLVPARIA